MNTHWERQVHAFSSLIDNIFQPKGWEHIPYSEIPQLRQVTCWKNMIFALRTDNDNEILVGDERGFSLTSTLILEDEDILWLEPELGTFIIRCSNANYLLSGTDISNLVVTKENN